MLDLKLATGGACANAGAELSTSAATTIRVSFNGIIGPVSPNLLPSWQSPDKQGIMPIDQSEMEQKTPLIE
jgi:hypothetical protein